MYLLVLGLALLTLKWMEIDPVAGWPWLAVLAPFALALVWWAWADASGYTKRKVAEREEKRRKNRLKIIRDNMNGATLRKRKKS